jgi:hypothetical protein
MITNLRKEDLSLSYLNAVCAYKGIAVEIQRHDEDSIDVMIKKVMVRQATRREFVTQIAVQLKATSQNLVEDENSFSFSLSIKNYNDLRRESSVPMILCVLRLPNEERDWLIHSVNELILRNCMYWCVLTNLPDSNNEETVSIRIAKENRLTPENALELMQKVAETGSL